MSTIGESALRFAASVASDGFKSSHAGVSVRICQSSASIDRFRSTSGVERDPTSFGISSASRRVRSSSLGRVSFHERMNEATTGQAQAGWSLCGSPAM